MLNTLKEIRAQKREVKQFIKVILVIAGCLGGFTLLQVKAIAEPLVEFVLSEYDLKEGIYKYEIVNNYNFPITFISLGNGVKPSLRDFDIIIITSPVGWTGVVRSFHESIIVDLQWWAQDKKVFIQPKEKKKGFAIQVPIIVLTEEPPSTYMDGSPMLPHHPEKFAFSVQFTNGERFYGNVSSNLAN